MKKLSFFVKLIISSMIVFFILYTCLFIIAKIGNKIDIKNSNTIIMYDNNNQSFYERNGDKKKWVELKNVSKYVVLATICSEDKNFYNHNGFDIPRIIKSGLINIKNKNLSQGASTITQQYARNLFLAFDKTWKRKLKEAWYAFKLETQYSKDEILEGYLNSINYGNGILGIENASWYYFNKSAKDLDLAESTMLVGIPKSPNNYSPLNNEKLAKKRQKTILKTLVDSKIITENTMKKALDESLVYYGNKENINLKTIMYYEDAVIKELEDLKIVSKDRISEEGLKIYTSLDVEAQKILEQSIDKNISSDNNIQVSSIMMNPKNGEILALVGGKDYSKSQYNRAVQAKRQVGSTMKPILYYAALENGLTSGSTFLSKPTTFSLDGNKTYSPNNYGNIYPNSNITMALAIAYSDNIYAIKTHLFLGESTLVKYAKKLGIKTDIKANTSLPLGTSELSMLEFISSFSAFANEGYKIEGHLIQKVEDGNGDILYEYHHDKKQILNKDYVYILNELLANTYDTSIKSYTAPTCASIAPKLTKKYAVKSGTTDYDLYTIGYNKDIIASVWTGYDDNRKLTSKENKFSKNIWADAVEEYLRNKENNWYEKPDNIVGVITDLNTGEVANNESKLKKVLYYERGTEPSYKKN